MIQQFHDRYIRNDKTCTFYIDVNIFIHAQDILGG